jgi:hypothetical protein
MKGIKYVLIHVHLRLPWNIMHGNAFTVVSSKWSNATVQQVCKEENWILWSPQRRGVGCTDTLEEARYSFLLRLITICLSFFLPGFCLFLNFCFLPLLLPCTSYLCPPFMFLLFLLILPCAVLISSFFQYLFLPFYLVSFLSFVFILPVFFFHSQFIQPLALSFLTPFGRHCNAIQRLPSLTLQISYCGVTRPFLPD